MFHDPSLVKRPRALLRTLLGLAEIGPSQGAGASAEREGNAVPCGENERMLEDIRNFILGNGLALTPDNLVAAHAAYSGASPQLRHRIRQKEMEGQRISQNWLSSQMLHIPANDAVVDPEVERLSQRLGRSIDRLKRTASTARAAAQNYGRDMAGHVKCIDDACNANAAAEKVIECAHAMMHLARELDDRLRVAETEAGTLRTELELARREATLDPLTQLPNRRGFDAAFEAEYRKACASVEPMSVAFCDIDHFKQINDSFGHETGDNIIRTVADILSGMSSERCHAARHGGEEFVVIFRGITIDEARIELDRARHALTDRRFVHERTGEIIGKVSFSAGIADVFACGSRVSALRAADMALYMAKEEGRNRIVIGLGDFPDDSRPA